MESKVEIGTPSWPVTAAAEASDQHLVSMVGACRCGEGDQEQGFQVFRFRPQERDQEERDARKAHGCEEKRRHADIGHNPAAEHDVEAPDEADGEKQYEVTKNHARPISGFGGEGQGLLPCPKAYHTPNRLTGIFR